MLPYCWDSFELAVLKHFMEKSLIVDYVEVCNLPSNNAEFFSSQCMVCGYKLPINFSAVKIVFCL